MITADYLLPNFSFLLRISCFEVYEKEKVTRKTNLHIRRKYPKFVTAPLSRKREKKRHRNCSFGKEQQILSCFSLSLYPSMSAKTRSIP